MPYGHACFLWGSKPRMARVAVAVAEAQIIRREIFCCLWKFWRIWKVWFQVCLTVSTIRSSGKITHSLGNPKVQNVYYLLFGKTLLYMKRNHKILTVLYRKKNTSTSRLLEFISNVLRILYMIIHDNTCYNVLYMISLKQLLLNYYWFISDAKFC